jgi:hypothetical protein
MANHSFIRILYGASGYVFDIDDGQIDYQAPQTDE